MNRRMLVRLLAPLFGLLLLGTLAAPVSAGPTVSCTTHQVPIALPALGTQQLSGQLCLPAGAPPDTVQVLVPGSTYNHSYWDFPVPGYSYARSAAAAGQATFAIDRFNTGNSAKLPSAAVLVDIDALAVHQVNTKLRAGAIGGTTFDKIVTVGHSLGSVIVVEEAALYRDVDGVILSGFSNYPSAEFVAGLATGQVVVPAHLVSPKFADQPLGDLSTPDGVRQKWFYAEGNFDPAVVAKDEQTKDVLTAGELASFPLPVAGPQTALIDVPVLLATAAKDKIFFCGLGPCSSETAVRAAETIHFATAPSFDVFVLPNSGHDLNLALNRGEFFTAAQQWVSQRVGD